jgi:hypothetical protein
MSVCHPGWDEKLACSLRAGSEKSWGLLYLDQKVEACCTWIFECCSSRSSSIIHGLCCWLVSCVLESYGMEACRILSPRRRVGSSCMQHCTVLPFLRGADPPVSTVPHASICVREPTFGSGLGCTTYPRAGPRCRPGVPIFFLEGAPVPTRGRGWWSSAQAVVQVTWTWLVCWWGLGQVV